MNRISTWRHALLVTTGLAGISLNPAIALAQPQSAGTRATTGADASDSGADIIVTARKREETLIEAPVAITAVTGAQLERLGINNLDTVARLVPQLLVGEGGGTVQGGNIVLRGIAGADANPFADQAVSFNIDGVQVARASIRRMAEMDLAQVEVLKGPQALFFGKNSPGGVISIRTADPTRTLSARLSGNYEFVGREWKGEGYISGPLTETLGARLAFYVNDSQGWFKYGGPPDIITTPTEKRTPNNTEYALRGTLLYEPGDQLNIRAKLTYNKLNGSGSSYSTQLVNCPLGRAQNAPLADGTTFEDCKADNKTTGYINFGPNFTAAGAPFGDGEPFLKQEQLLGGVETNYSLSDQVQLTSVTGYYWLKLLNQTNFNSTYNPASALPSQNNLEIQEFSQELRLSTDFDGFLNIVTGGHFQDSKADTGSFTMSNANAPTFVNHYQLTQKGTAYSIFGQLIFDITPSLQFTAGGRYSNEKKRLSRVLVATSATGPLLPVVTPVRKQSWTDFSPEATLRYHPSRDLTVYASYKQGFLSGGFNSGSTTFTSNLAFDQQTIEGFEGGVKASLLDGDLVANLAAYSYKVKGLQVQTSIATIQLITNAGKVSVKGLEFDFNYRTPIEGLSVYGGAAYNRARYQAYTVQCYRGQSQAEGCNAGDPLNGRFLTQDLAGAQVVRAPDWMGNAGFQFSTPISSGLELGLTGGLTYSSSYSANPTNAPNGRVPAYTLFDASIDVGSADDSWQVALIGRNLTEERYWTRSNDSVGTGGTSGLVTPGIKGDANGTISRGREIMLRLTYKFGTN